MCELSVVILGYRAESYLRDFVVQVYSEIQAAEIQSFEIILVANYDDDSDKTPQIAIDLSKKYEHLKVLSLKKKGKMGWDMRKGMEAAQGSYICVLDGDGQMPASDIVAVYNIIKSEQFDVVKTYRSVRYDGWYRVILSKVYNILFNILYQPRIKLKDINSKPKIISRAAYHQLTLKSNDWFTDAEIMIQAIELQLSICEVATVFYENERRKSYVGWKTVIEFIYNLFFNRLFTFKSTRANKNSTFV